MIAVEAVRCRWFIVTERQQSGQFIIYNKSVYVLQGLENYKDFSLHEKIQINSDRKLHSMSHSRYKTRDVY